jgi:uncharacterized protein YkwD
MDKMGCAVVLCLALAFQAVPPSAVDDASRLEQRMAELINVERDARGLAPFVLSPELSRVARDYSRKMADSREIDHDLSGPVEDRIRHVLPDTCTFGENVSKHTSIDYSLGDLLSSPGHRANLLSNRFTTIGIGIVRGEDDYLYITQEFARACDPRPRPGKRSKT